MAKIQTFIWCLFLLCACVRPADDRNEQPTPTIIHDTVTIIRVDSVQFCPEPLLVEQFITLAKSYIGVQEETGRNDGVEVEAFLNTCGLGEGNPWCAAYIAYVLDSLEQQYPELCAWSPAYFTDPTRIVWQRSERSELIPAGSVFGLYYESKGRVAHVGIIYKDTNRGYVITLEGNTNAGGSRDGNMAAIRMRRKSQIFVAANWLK